VTTTEEEPRWYAVHTRSHHERTASKELAAQNFEVYLPEYRTMSKRKDRKKEIKRPLFPGYVFVRTSLTGGKRIAVLQTKGVVRIIGAGHKPVAIPDHELESVRILLSNSQDAGPCPAAEKGQLVEVMEGPLRGVVGVVEAAKKRKIVVSVELVGRAVSATLDTEAVVPYLDK
jgi:transcription antitermination factor NusG